MPPDARFGWGSDFPRFHDTPARAIRASLQELVRDASTEQISAWDDSIPDLQREVGEVVACDANAGSYNAILEYELPMESRRPDVILLLRGPVVVLELKGKSTPSQADIDQAAAYARDWRVPSSRSWAGSICPHGFAPLRSAGRIAPSRDRSIRRRACGDARSS